MAISALLADDSEEFRQAVRRLLESQSAISLVGSATDFSEPALFATLLRPDVVLKRVGTYGRGLHGASRCQHQSDEQDVSGSAGAGN